MTTFQHHCQRGNQCGDDIAIIRDESHKRWPLESERSPTHLPGLGRNDIHRRYRILLRQDEESKQTQGTDEERTLAVQCELQQWK